MFELMMFDYISSCFEHPCVSLGGPPEISRPASWVVPETDVGSAKQMCSYFVGAPQH